MKTVSRKILLLCLFVLIALVSCATSGTTASGGLPLWYQNPQARASSGQIAFTSIAKGADSRMAQLLAYSDMIDVLEEYTGLVFSQDDYRELSTTNRLSKYELSIVDEFTSIEEEGKVTVCMLALADRRIVEGSVSEQKARDKEKKQEIENLILSGDKAIKESNSLKGIKYYLQSLVLSYGLDGVTKEYSYDEISSYAVDLLSRITLSLNGNVSISAKIKESFFPTKVSDCQIQGSFEYVDSSGTIKSRNYSFMTDENGVLGFSKVFSSSDKRVTASFSLDIWDEITALEEVGAPVAQTCREIVDSKRISVVYESGFKMGSIAVSGLEYTNGGLFSNGISSCNTLCQILDNGGAHSYALYCNEDLTDEQLILSLQSSGTKAGCFLIVRLGQLESVQAENCKIAVCEGSGILYDMNTMKVLLDTGVLEVTGIGNTPELAVENANYTLCEIINDLVRTVYV